MVKKNTKSKNTKMNRKKQKTIHLTAAQAKEFIDKVRCAFAVAHHMGDSEFFMGDIEGAIEDLKIPHLKAKYVSDDDGVFDFKFSGAEVEVK